MEYLRTINNAPIRLRRGGAQHNRVFLPQIRTTGRVSRVVCFPSGLLPRRERGTVDFFRHATHREK